MSTLICDLCGGRWSKAKMTVTHALKCPNHPDDTVVAMGAARFARATHPAELNPITALEAAIAWLSDPANEKASHVIVLVGRDTGDDGCSATKYFQAGTYRHHGQMGLCLEAMHMIRESGE